MKIELTVARDYVSWGLWEGTRELFQNGIDAKKDGFEFEVDYSEKYERLRLVTKGVTLETKSLLLGSSTKRQRADLIGKFGEGYKLAFLALLNSGHPVVVRTGADKWVPEIAASERFGGELVLFVDIQKKAIKGREAIEIEVENVKVFEWMEVCNKLLALKPAKEEVRTEQGAILFDQDKKGQVYVGGIFVQVIHDTEFGYDFAPGVAKLDRDRRMVDRWDLEVAMARAWITAIDVKPELAKELHRLLMEGRPESHGVRYYYPDPVLKRRSFQKLANRFRGDFGENAIPVLKQEEIDEAQSYGKRGVVVPEDLFEVIKDEMPTLNNLKREKKSAVLEWIDFDTLNPAEQECLAMVQSLARVAHPELASAKVKVVLLRDKKQSALAVDEEILISREALKDTKEAIKSMVVELAVIVLNGHYATNAMAELGNIRNELWVRMVLSALGKLPSSEPTPDGDDQTKEPETAPEEPPVESAKEDAATRAEAQVVDVLIKASENPEPTNEPEQPVEEQSQNREADISF